MSLLIKTAPDSEPVTVGEVKAILRLDSDADDTMITSNITAAREFAEKITKRSLALKGYTFYMDRFPAPGQAIKIPAPPLVTVDYVKYLDSALTQQTWDSAQYLVINTQDPGLIIAKPGFVFPSASCAAPDAVEISLTAGYGGEGNRPIAEHLRLGIMQLAAHWYDHPEFISVGRADAEAIVPMGLLDLFKANKFYVY